jgi:YHS domain-containing protein
MNKMNFVWNKAVTSYILDSNTMKYSLFLMATVSLIVINTVSAAPKELNNIDKAGVGIQGYDPVGFFKENKPVKGNPSFSERFHGVNYYFASEENRATFKADPAKYEPQFGGYCAYGVSRDSASPIKVEAFQIVDGRLLMQYSEEVRDLFNKDTPGNLKLADQKWPSVVEKKGKVKN